MLVVAPEYGVDASGGYRPGGLAQFARLTTRALSTSERIETLVLWGLLDDPLALDRTLRAYIDEARRPGMQVRYRGFSGRRARMSLRFAAEHLAFDHVMFMHLGPGRLATLRMFRPYSFWLVGIEVRKCLDRIERRAVTRAQPLLSISTFSSDEMRAFNPGLPGAQAVHLGMEPDAAWSMTDHRGGAYHAADRAPAVMIVGRLAANERYKGHDQLIEAWPGILTRVPNAELWIVGDGDDRERLEAKAARLADASSKIRFLGRLPHDELVDRYARARVFAMPSTGEGFGLVFLEAMSHGLPCVCSHDSAAEIVVDGQTGFVVDQTASSIAVACEALLTDAELADRMGAAGRARLADRFSFDAFRDRVLHAVHA